MKKLLAVLTLVLLSSASAQAWPFHHGRGHHRPAPTIVYKSHHHHFNAPLIALASGMAGFAVGSSMVSAAPGHYTVTSDTRQCFAVVSRSTGNVTQRCISSPNGDNQVLYVD